MICTRYLQKSKNCELGVDIARDEHFVERRSELLECLERMANDIRQEIAVEQGVFTVKQWKRLG